MSAFALQAGNALCSFDEQAKPIVWARLLHVTEHWVYLMRPAATGDDGFVEWYIPAPFRHHREQVKEEMQARGLRIAEFKGPPRWYWTEQDLENMRQGVGSAAEVDKGLGTKGDRRDIDAWIRDRDTNWYYIKPLFGNSSISEVLETGAYRSWPRERAAAIGVDCRTVTRAVRLYLFSLGQLGALIPARDRQGGAGKEKFSSVLTGRKTESPREDGSSGFISTEDARQEMKAGWKKYKKKGTSVDTSTGPRDQRRQPASRRGRTVGTASLLRSRGIR